MVKMKMKKGQIKEDKRIIPIVIEDCSHCKEKGLVYPLYYTAVSCPVCKLSLRGCEMKNSTVRRAAYHFA